MEEEWPFLFEATHLFDHASQLLGFPVLNKLAEELSSKEAGINNYLDSKGKLLSTYILSLQLHKLIVI